MRDRNIKSAQYAPGDASQIATIPDLVRFLTDEHLRIAAAISLAGAGHLDILYAPPKKPRNGDSAYADGTSWNPGSGKGVYFYNGAVWTLIKAIP